MCGWIPESDMSDPAASSSSAAEPGPSRGAWQRFQRNRPAVFSLWLLLVVLLAVVAWPIILKIASASGPSGADFAQRLGPDQVSDAQLQPPGPAHWFGTDIHGRDLFSRVLYGAQVSLLVGCVAAVLSLVIGVAWGAVAGYAGGRTDGFMMRVVDILYSLPSILFVIVLITSFEALSKRWLARLGVQDLDVSARLVLLVVGLGAVSWLTMARIVRGQVLSLRQRAFVQASRALGAGPIRILARHIIPNTLGVVIVYLALTIPAVVLYESFLSYLGLGIQPPMASLGSLIAEGADQINPIRSYWWLLTFPSAFLVITLLALNFLCDGLRDAWDVRG